MRTGRGRWLTSARRRVWSKDEQRASGREGEGVGDGCGRGARGGGRHGRKSGAGYTEDAAPEPQPSSAALAQVNHRRSQIHRRRRQIHHHCSRICDRRIKNVALTLMPSSGEGRGRGRSASASMELVGGAVQWRRERESALQAGERR